MTRMISRKQSSTADKAKRHEAASRDLELSDRDLNQVAGGKRKATKKKATRKKPTKATKKKATRKKPAAAKRGKSKADLEKRLERLTRKVERIAEIACVDGQPAVTGNPSHHVHQYAPNPALAGMTYNPYNYYPTHVPADAHLLPSANPMMEFSEGVETWSGNPRGAPAEFPYTAPPVGSGDKVTNPEEIAAVKSRLLSY